MNKLEILQMDELFSWNAVWGCVCSISIFIGGERVRLKIK